MGKGPTFSYLENSTMQTFPVIFWHSLPLLHGVQSRPPGCVHYFSACSFGSKVWSVTKKGIFCFCGLGQISCLSYFLGGWSVLQWIRHGQLIRHYGLFAPPQNLVIIFALFKYENIQLVTVDSNVNPKYRGSL